MQVLNDPGPWWGVLRGNLSIVDLIASETIPAREAAALWWALERGASLMTAAGPSGAGKTTLANALLPFLPAAARAYVTSGPGDALAVPDRDGPSYLLINELSRYGPRFYLSGPAARRAFALLREDWRVIGTLHAESVAEAVEAMRDDFSLPLSDVARITLIVIIRVAWGRRALQHRVVEIGLLLPDRDGVQIAELASWNRAENQLQVSDAPAGLSALASWSGLPLASVELAIEARAAVLTELGENAQHQAEEVAAAVARFRA